MSCASEVSHLACNQCDVRSVSSDFLLPLLQKMKVCNLVECVSVTCVSVCLYVYSSESEMVSEGEEMEDYYLVYCIYILSIISFTPKFFFQFLPYFVVV